MCFVKFRPFMCIAKHCFYVHIFHGYVCIIPHGTYYTHYTLKLVNHIAYCFVNVVLNVVAQNTMNRTYFPVIGFGTDQVENALIVILFIALSFLFLSFLCLIICHSSHALDII